MNGVYVDFRERTDDLEDPRPAPADPVAPAPSAVVVPLAVMGQHPRTAETYWRAIGWQEQADAFAPVRLRLQKQADAAERRAVAAEHSVVGRGDRLGLIRANAGLTARQLSRIVEVLPSDVTEWERNLRPIPNSVVPAIERACKDTLIPTWRVA